MNDSDRAIPLFASGSLSAEPPHPPPVLTAHDLHLFNEGTHYRLYEKLGAHVARIDGRSGVVFAVWAPEARRVAVIGDFNQWDEARHPLEPQGSSGIWQGLVPDIGPGALYKFAIRSRLDDQLRLKADPYGTRHEVPPRSASIVHDISNYKWHDELWMASRREHNALSRPISIYEVHLGSWRRSAEPDRTHNFCRDIGPRLVEYVVENGFTHVEFMPVMHHPFSGSWGYQITGYFAVDARLGTPEEFMALVDQFHQYGVGVILDWVPSHFPTDGHGLGDFDGSHLYEHADPRKGFHPDWRSYIFNYGRHEVRSFLISNALYWLDMFHADGLRVDGVASMLYLDYSREAGEWIPNEYGGRENLEAIGFLRQLNAAAYAAHDDIQMIAEESTDWPMVSRPTYVGGLGFGLKWDMGWMHDSLAYFRHDPVHRRFHHHELTFRGLYQFTENFVLPLSHDEVVHGKGSLLSRMPGDDWQKFATLRLLLAQQWLMPGKKLLFMGGEIGQWAEWSHDHALEWSLLQYEPHRGIQSLVRALNRLYREQRALHELDCEPAGFAWLDADDAENSVYSYFRLGRHTGSLLVVLNCTPVPRRDYAIGVPAEGAWRELLNTDSEHYGGSGVGNLGRVSTESRPHRGQPHLLRIQLPPLGAVVFAAPDGPDDEPSPAGQVGP